MTAYMCGGVPMVLGKELGQGGEGVVYALGGQPGEVAKIYRPQAPPDAERAAKIRLMARSGRDYRNIAWPRREITEAGTGRLCGFTMARVTPNSRSLIKLYLNSYRSEHFPSADWRMLVLTAGNLARLVAQLHHDGVVVGDLNTKNVLVDDKALVWLVDADSFQIRRPDGRVLTSDVGVSDYLAPELQGVSLDGLVRSASQDVFSLGVLVFQILFLGRHPFAGIHRQDVDLGQAIRSGLFVHVDGGTSRPPPNSVPLEIVGPQLAGLFEGTLAGDPQSRPTAQDWVAGLDELRSSLAQCTIDSSHYYYSPRMRCPWCEVQPWGSRPLFGRPPPDLPPVLGPVDIDHIDWDLLWRRIEEAPEVRLPWPDAALPPRPPAVPSAWFLWFLAAIAGLFAFAIPEAWIAASVLVCSSLIAPGMRRRRADWERLAAAFCELGSLASRSLSQRQDVIEKLAVVRSQGDDRHQVLESRYQNAMGAGAQAKMRKRARKARLDEAAIPGVGISLTATLLSFGIETAQDVLDSEARAAGVSGGPVLPALLSIPGVGPVKEATLLAWARQASCVAKAKSKVKTPVQERDLRNTLAAAYRVELDALAVQLRSGAAYLEWQRDIQEQALNAAVKALNELARAQSPRS